MPPDLIEKNPLLLPDQSAPIRISNGYVDLYPSDSEDELVFEEIIDSKTLNPINTYSVVHLSNILISTPHNVLKKQLKTRLRINLATIKRSHYNTTVSSVFLLTDLHSVSQVIIRSHTDNIAPYNDTDTAYCADSGSSEDMLPDYSTFKTYHHLSNRYAKLGDTTRLPIEGIGTAV